MKRFFSLILFALAIHIVAYAQQFEFQYKGKVYANGSTLVINAETDMFGELACETNPASNPDDGLLIVGKDGAYINGSAHLTILEHTFKAKTIQWCMGGTCVPMKDITELDKTFEGTSIRMLFDAFTIRQEGYLLAKLDVTVGSESQSLYIEFSNGQHASTPDTIKGDVNGDGKVDVADIMAVMNIIIANGNNQQEEINNDN